MRLTVVGCSGSMPGPEGPASCYLLEHDGFRVVVDMGNGSLGGLMRHIDLVDVDAVVLSHLHADHCIDVLSLYVAREYGPYGGRRIPVVGPPGTHERLAAAYGLAREPGMRGVFEFHDLTAVEDVGPFEVTAARTPHPIEAYAIRFQADDLSVVYSGDSGPTDVLATLADGADIFLCEASFVDGEDNPPDLHLTGADAGRYADMAQVGRLVVTHVPPWNDSTRAVVEARHRFDGPVSAAAPGSAYDCYV